MIRGVGGVWQALLGSLFTWGLTAAGAAGVFVLESQSALVLDTSLGFAAGVMTAASFWSLLAPAIELSEASYGHWSWLPVAIGFALGAAFVHFADIFLPDSSLAHQDPPPTPAPSTPEKNNNQVGVGFGAVGSSPKATFENAVTLALGIGIQNFPEGLAVSLPLRGLGYSKGLSFWYGQLSGMVEPVAAVVGALGVGVMEAALPYALAFAAGAMIYVVVDDIVPEAASHGNGKLASWAAITGFVVMMSLDVGLG